MTSIETVPAKLVSIQYKWASIARDIALMSQPYVGGTEFTAKDIANRYELSNAEFILLMKTPAFLEILKAELVHIKELGPHAGHKLRAEAMLIDVQERLYIRALNGEMEDKQLLQFLAVLLKSAGLDGGMENKTDAVVQNQTAVSIAFNVPKLPSNKKLSHIMNLPQTNVVDVVST